MLKIKKLKKIKTRFPVMLAEKALNSKQCEDLINEIKNSSSFDDMIMGGRSRINKGSKNFKRYIKKSKISKKLFTTFNNPLFFKKIQSIFKKNYKNIIWSNTYDPKKFMKNKFTNKKLMNSSELKKMYGNKYRNPSVNLDIDFSVSKSGYRLKPHRDDITRLYNFLIYLNDIPKKNGGSLTIYQKKKNTKIRSRFRRFPKISELALCKEFTPKQGSVIFFQSTPNSYHGVKRFKEHKGQKRFFIYGSYALSAPVLWKYKNVTYLPFIKPTSKRLLTSSHVSNYILDKSA